jgi:hypothetical protein
MGTMSGGGVISLRGENFVDVPCFDKSPYAEPCLMCLFTSVTAGAEKVRVAATFISSTLATCLVPPAAQLGFEGQAPGGCITTPDPPVSNWQISITASTNGLEFTDPAPNLMYTYTPTVVFERFEPSAGPSVGNTTVRVYGRGFCKDSQITCRFGNIDVQAKYINEIEVQCMTPSWSTALEVGGVFMGFATNGMDFCELLPVSDVRVTCNFTYANPVKARPFFYHRTMEMQNILPPAGLDAGGTEVHIEGTGFTDYGQTLRVYFGENNYQQNVLADIVNETHIRFTTPRLPEPMNVQSEDTAGEAKYYIRDKAYPIRVSSNNQQFTDKKDGSNCKIEVGDKVVANLKAQCKLVFVMFTWYLNPNILSLMATRTEPKWFSGLSPTMYRDI